MWAEFGWGGAECGADSLREKVEDFGEWEKNEGTAATTTTDCAFQKWKEISSMEMNFFVYFFQLLPARRN